MFEAKLAQASLLKKVLDSINSLIDEGTWDCSEAGGLSCSGEMKVVHYLEASFISIRRAVVSRYEPASDGLVPRESLLAPAQDGGVRVVSLRQECLGRSQPRQHDQNRQMCRK